MEAVKIFTFIALGIAVLFAILLEVFMILCCIACIDAFFDSDAVGWIKSHCKLPEWFHIIRYFFELLEKD